MQEPTPTPTEEHDTVELVRGLVRPALSIMFGGALVAAWFVDGGSSIENMPDWLRFVFAAPPLTWFGLRPFEKIIKNGG